MNLNDCDELVIRTDGSCEPKNPGGIACCAWTLSEVHADKHFYSEARVVADGGDLATNNFAEYCGLGFALRYLVDQKWNGNSLYVYSDSQLLVKQITDQWKCKAQHLQKLKRRILQLVDQLGFSPSHMGNDELASILIEREGGYDTFYQQSALLKTCMFIWNPRDQNTVTDQLCEDVYRSYLKKRSVTKPEQLSMVDEGLFEPW